MDGRAVLHWISSAIALGLVLYCLHCVWIIYLAERRLRPQPSGTRPLRSRVVVLVAAGTATILGLLVLTPRAASWPELQRHLLALQAHLTEVLGASPHPAPRVTVARRSKDRTLLPRQPAAMPGRSSVRLDSPTQQASVGVVLASPAVARPQVPRIDASRPTDLRTRPSAGSEPPVTGTPNRSTETKLLPVAVLPAVKKVAETVSLVSRPEGAGAVSRTGPGRSERRRPQRVEDRRAESPDHPGTAASPDTQRRLDRVEHPARVDASNRGERTGHIEHRDHFAGPDRTERLEPLQRAEPSERPGRPMRFERPDRPRTIERAERIGRIDRPERVEWPERLERIDRPERLERPERIERIDRPERLERLERPERIERVERGGRRG